MHLSDPHFRTSTSRGDPVQRRLLRDLRVEKVVVDELRRVAAAPLAELVLEVPEHVVCVVRPKEQVEPHRRVTEFTQSL